jgi:hypothetical protein
MKRLCLALCGLLLSGLVAAQDAPALLVQADQSLGPISPYVYGSNFGVYSAIPAAYIKEAQASGVRYLRWGGGFSDQRELTPANIDTLMMNARLIGAEPALTVRLVGSTPEQSAEDVRYANLQKGYNVRYWSIGNEPTLHASLFNMTYNAEIFNREWREHAEAMLAVDPTIQLVGPDLHQYPGVPALNLKDDQGRDWLVEFLRANGDLVSVVAVHRYPFPRSQADPTIRKDDLRQNSAEWETNIIPSLREAMQATLGRQLPIAITEVNSSWANNIGGEATLDSHYNALWYGDVLGRLIRQQVFIVAQWSFSQPGSSFGLLSPGVQPIYYTFQMYQRFGTEALMSRSDVPDVEVYAARREDGALTLMVVNLGYEAVSVPLILEGFTPAETAEVWLFDPDHRALSLGEQPFGESITLSAESMTLFIVSPKG